jgi:hypothetical protein
MQSDPRTQLALDAVAEPRARFRTAVESARDQMRAYIASHRADSDERATNSNRELGAFASGRIDTNRFATLFSNSGSVSYEAITRIERFIAGLDEVLAKSDGFFAIEVPRGGNAATAAADAFGNAGCAFGAVLAFQAAKTGSYRYEQHERRLESFPFNRWNRGERLMAPPLVMEVDGEDFSGDQLAGFIDGNVRIIVVIRGVSSPAPLARLVTPGVLVIQSTTAESLAKLAGYEGPAVAALVPDGAAIFTHDPRGGPALRDRLGIDYLPDPPLRSVGSRSVWQQREELAHLKMLAKLAAEESAQVDTLAGWLLQAGGFAQSDGAQR